MASCSRTGDGAEMQDGEESSGLSLFSNRRAMSSTTALIVLVVVVIIAGAGAYGGLSSVSPSKTTVTTCTPASACVKISKLNDVTMFVPYTVAYGQTYSQAAVGTSIQASVAVTGSETIKTFSVTWGPNLITSGSTGTLSYTYASAGLYTLVPSATDTAGVAHTGLAQLASLKVNPSSASIGLGEYPTLATSLTNTTGGAYGWIGAGGTISVNASYSAQPTNSLWSTKAPSLVGPSGITPTKSSPTTTTRAPRTRSRRPATTASRSSGPARTARKRSTRTSRGASTSDRPRPDSAARSATCPLNRAPTRTRTTTTRSHRAERSALTRPRTTTRSATSLRKGSTSR